MVTKGDEVGGDGGTEFTLLKNNRPVEQLDVWYGKGSGPAEPYTILRGIEVRWSDGSTGHAGYCPKDEQDRILHTSFDFEDKGQDPLDWLDIYASTSRVDSLRLVTQNEGDYFEAGGIGGDKSSQPAHGRKLCGFQGRAASDIDKLGAIFT
ncbi:hypothetical protein EIK77_007571 [Talaromyces pinophilus]|jgi:hypothetical protein|uniref:Jacalin-type lectin domain-containing protein n=1 Tax=Talaromyces pinophilus TaxID=128442 RepID=A0A0B8MXI0_TALPI|nr:hypothetical protein DPV78_003780 [Talaromyces pinophilus]KAI7971972.1 hypothetical protein EIK77_007571 [Talaromyces pinophilus]PCG88221.1 Mannose-binding lectin [Penicillium occitanis (nom. inval.)]PCG90104.1 hypothetical protein PENOC_103720 [Penicillium occitanis (nom. inval.)]GAM33467.1 hypothetical protein TCE0_004r00377 [Talaromyces pinophilus]